MQALLLGKKIKLLRVIASILQAHGQEVYVSNTFKEAWQKLADDQPKLLIITTLTEDYLNFIIRVKKNLSDSIIAVIAIQNELSVDQWRSAFKAGVDNIIIKQESFKNFEIQMAFIEKWADKKSKIISAGRHSGDKLNPSHHFSFSDAPFGMAIISLNDQLLEVNDSFCQILDYTKSELLGISFKDLLFEEDLLSHKKGLQKIRNGEFSHYKIEQRFYHKDGHIISTLSGISAVRDTQKKIQYFIEQIIDFKNTRPDFETRIQSILESTVDAIITVDAFGKIKSFNKSAQKMFGYSEDEVLNQNVKMLTPAPFREQYDSYLEIFRLTGEKRIVGKQSELIGQRKDGSNFPIDISVSEVILDNRRIYAGIIRDITERRKLEAELLRISEREKRRIGQDLHDGLGQLLSGIALITQGLANKLKVNEVPEADEAQEILNLIKDADHYARKLAHGLMPAELETNGLSAALSKLTSNSERLFGIECYFEGKNDILFPDKSISLHLYRIAQEAISNAVKHGKATKVTVHLNEEDKLITLSIKDNGIGFPKSKREDQGIGVQIMSYRSKIVNGNLVIKSKENHETEVICTISRETLNSMS